MCTMRSFVGPVGAAVGMASLFVALVACTVSVADIDECLDANSGASVVLVSGSCFGACSEPATLAEGAMSTDLD
jgi:hypothetical protein